MLLLLGEVSDITVFKHALLSVGNTWEVSSFVNMFDGLATVAPIRDDYTMS